MFHKEGIQIIVISGIAYLFLSFIIYHFLGSKTIKFSFIIFLTILYVLILQFFRNPDRKTNAELHDVIAPVDGKVVISEIVYQGEYFKKKCFQISIFMSPFNVHVTRYPISGHIVYSKYHEGDYLVAWHPKSSEKNERTTVAIKHNNGQEIIYKQIAGAFARRIVNYAKVGAKVIVGEDSGFIKFGSRVDILIPTDAEILVSLGDRPVGGESVIARLKSR